MKRTDVYLCKSLGPKITRIIFIFRIFDQTQEFASAASSTSHTTATSFSRHFYRNYRNDYFSNGAILNSLFRPYTENAVYLPYSSHYYQCHHGSLYHRRLFSTSTARHFAEKDEAKSKVERTLALLKEELELREKENKELQAVKDAASILKKKSLWQKFIDECKHYYHGFKLLGVDFKVSARLLWQVLRGHTLSRKERRQVINFYKILHLKCFIYIYFSLSGRYRTYFVSFRF